MKLNTIFLIISCAVFYKIHGVETIKYDLKTNYNPATKIFTTTAQTDNQKIGHIHFGISQKNSQHGFIYELKVSPSFRNNGIGFRLMHNTLFELEKLENHSLTAVKWDVVPERSDKATFDALMRFYKKFNAKTTIKVGHVACMQYTFKCPTFSKNSNKK